MPALFAAFSRKRPLTVSYRCATMILPGPLRGRRPPGRFWPRPSRDVHGGRFFSTCSRSLRPPPPALPPPGEGGAGSSAHPPGVQTPATGGDEKTWTETHSVQVNKTSIYFVDLYHCVLSISHPLPAVKRDSKSRRPDCQNRSRLRERFKFYSVICSSVKMALISCF